MDRNYSSHCRTHCPSVYRLVFALMLYSSSCRSLCSFGFRWARGWPSTCLMVHHFDVISHTEFRTFGRTARRNEAGSIVDNHGLHRVSCKETPGDFGHANLRVYEYLRRVRTHFSLAIRSQTSSTPLVSPIICKEQYSSWELRDDKPEHARRE